MFDSGSPSAPLSPGIETIRQDAGWFRPAGGKVICLKGEDRKGWLQGQVTQDMRDLRVGHSLAFCLVTPTGQLETYGAVWATEDQLFVVVDRPEVLLDRVERFVILEDVRAELMPGEIMSVQGARASRILSEKFSLPSVDVIIDRETLLLRNDRTGSGGWDLLGPEETTAWLCEQLPEISEGDLKLATLEAGIPWPGLDADAKTLPPELGSAFENRTVSHKKGCYQGQEVLMRIHSRGRTTKTWVGLSLDGEVKPGDEVMAEGVLAGKICRASLSSSYGWIATAILKNDFAYPGTSVKVSEVRGQVVRLPFLRYD